MACGTFSVDLPDTRGLPSDAPQSAAACLFPQRDHFKQNTAACSWSASGGGVSTLCPGGAPVTISSIQLLITHKKGRPCPPPGLGVGCRGRWDEDWSRVQFVDHFQGVPGQRAEQTVSPASVSCNKLAFFPFFLNRR